MTIKRPWQVGKLGSGSKIRPVGYFSRQSKVLQVTADVNRNRLKLDYPKSHLQPFMDGLNLMLAWNVLNNEWL